MEARKRQMISENTRQNLVHNGDFGDVDSKYGPKPKSLLRGNVWLVLFTFHSCLMLFVHVRNTHFPEPKSLSSAKPGEFVEERARKYLTDITALGPRYVGSQANEIHTVEYLLKEISKIKGNANAVHDIQVDVQTVSGSFTLKFLGEFTSAYDNVNNVIVKLSPKGGAPDSMMINCHYDSVLDSPGASDDAVTCCLMLEVLQVITLEDIPMQHSIIFIFNGAEENILQASHGFISQHPWAKDIRAFVNLDSAGAGGRELLFQAGPENPWLLQMYAEEVPHPYASSFGQEVFESGLIPSDTDYRIYRDFGKIPGLDIAYIHNGYVYHTDLDNPSMIPEGCMQRGGENLLSLTKAMANSPLLHDAGEYRHGSLVFFDIVGLFLVHYPARMGYVLNMLGAVSVFLRLARKARSKSEGISGASYVKQLVTSLLVLVTSWVAALLLAVSVGLTVTALGGAMCWFTHTWLVLGLYVAPVTAALLSVHLLAKKKLYKNVANLWAVEAVSFDANMTFSAILLIFLTYKQINSAALVLLYIALPLVLREGVATVFHLNFKDNHSVFLLLHLLGLLLPCLLFEYLFYGLLEMFIPVMGRVGAATIPDVFVGGVIGLLVIVVSGYQVGIVYISRRVDLVVKGLAGVTIITLAVALLTPLGFPYKANPEQPSRQRILAFHADRSFHDFSGQTVNRDSGLWLLPFDYNGVKFLESHVEGIADAKALHEKCDGPYCSLPFLYPLIMLTQKSFYIDGPRINPSPAAELSLLDHTVEAGNRHNFTFSVTGPHHMNVYLSPRGQTSIERWSLGSGHPMPTVMPNIAQQETYFIFYSYGTKPKQPWTFWLQLQAPEGHAADEPLMDLSIGAHYTEESRFTPVLLKFLDQLPDWSQPVTWSITYQAFVF